MISKRVKLPQLEQFSSTDTLNLKSFEIQPCFDVSWFLVSPLIVKDFELTKAANAYAGFDVYFWTGTLVGHSLVVALATRKAFKDLSLRHKFVNTTISTRLLVGVMLFKVLFVQRYYTSTILSGARQCGLHESLIGAIVVRF